MGTYRLAPTQIDLAFWDREKRDRKGEWTQNMGAVRVNADGFVNTNGHYKKAIKEAGKANTLSERNRLRSKAYDDLRAGRINRDQHDAIHAVLHKLDRKAHERRLKGPMFG